MSESNSECSENEIYEGITDFEDSEEPSDLETIVPIGGKADLDLDSHSSEPESLELPFSIPIKNQQFQPISSIPETTNINIRFVPIVNSYKENIKKNARTISLLEYVKLLQISQSIILENKILNLNQN